MIPFLCGFASASLAFAAAGYLVAGRRSGQHSAADRATRRRAWRSSWAEYRSTNGYWT